MDLKKFITLLPSWYENWGKDTIKPLSKDFESILSPCQGQISPCVLSLLNGAVNCLEDEEIYGQIGSEQGFYLMGALLNHAQVMAYGVDNLDDEQFNQLVNNLTQFNLDEQVFFCNQNHEEFFADLKELQPELKIGVYFYNGPHDYRSVLMGLLLARSFLADRALMIINNSNYQGVQQAIYDFINSNKSSNLLLELPVGFGNGISVITYDLNQVVNYSWQDIENHYRNPLIIKSLYDLHCVLELKIKPSVLSNLMAEALELNKQGQIKEAIDKYKEALIWQKNNPFIYNNIASLYFKLEQYQEGLPFAEVAVKLDITIALHHFNLGKILEKLEQKDQAILAFENSINLAPDHLDSYIHLGHLLVEDNQLERAELIYKKITELDQENFNIYLILGDILFKQGKYESAIENYNQALILKPKTPAILEKIAKAYEANDNPSQALLYYGYVEYRQDKYREAIPKFEEFFKDNKGDIFDYVALATCYRKLAMEEKEREIYRNALQQFPSNTYLYTHFFNFLPEERYNEKDQAFIAQLIANDPDNIALRMAEKHILPVLYNNTEEIEFYRHQFGEYINYLEHLINSNKLEDAKNLDNALIIIGSCTNFYLGYQYHNDKDIQQRYGNFVHYAIEKKYQKFMAPLTMPSLTKEGKIKIGYVSMLMHFHTVSKLFKGWIKYHNSQQFEVSCYYGSEYPDAMVHEIKSYSDKFHHIPNNLEKLAQQILDDNLHILVFLDVGMNPLMMQLAVLRLAPIQCTTWGHPITTGSPNMDYFLSSELMEPENAQDHYTETLIKLPNISIAYEKPVLPTDVKSRSFFGLKDEAIIYLSCQSLFKYLPQFNYIFAEIAKQIPQAQFVFLKTNNMGNLIKQKFLDRLKRAFAEQGLNSDDHCVILSQLDRQAYLSLNLISDIYLDTLGWSGGNTTLEALGCNLPIVTYPGKFMRSRHSYAMLKMIGITETIAHSEQEYIDIAVKLGLDANWRNTIKNKIQSCHDRLYDDREAVKGLEQFYQTVVQNKIN